MIDGIAERAALDERHIKGRYRRLLSAAFMIRAIVLWTLMPEAQLSDVIIALAGDLALLPWSRRWHAASERSCLDWRRALGPAPLDRHRQEPAPQAQVQIPRHLRPRQPGGHGHPHRPGRHHHGQQPRLTREDIRNPYYGNPSSHHRSSRPDRGTGPPPARHAGRGHVLAPATTERHQKENRPSMPKPRKPVALLAALHGAFLVAPITGPAAQAAPDAHSGRDLMDAQPGSDEHDQARLRSVFEGCVARLESAGLVKHLTFGDLVLLQPELLDVYAGAIVNASRGEPDGLGSMLESRVLALDFSLPQQERLSDAQQEKLLVIATLEELTRHEIVLREETEEGVQLVFPSAFRRDLPSAAEPSSDTVDFSFEGPVANIYATLIVRLSRSNRFVRKSMWQSAAQFETELGGLCTVHLVRADEGCGALRVGYSEGVAELAKFQFERFIVAHLERRATPGTIRRDRHYSCPDCRIKFSVEQVEAARRRGRTTLLCPIDETSVTIDDPYEAMGQTQEGVRREMDASADAARSIAVSSSVIRGKEETTDFDVFLCHNVADKPAVRWAAERLRERGILPWLDERELQPGLPWQEELERQIGNIRSRVRW